MAGDDDNGSLNPIQVQEYLGGMDYPASKDDLVQKAKNNGAGDGMISTLNNLPDKQYEDPTDVTEAIGDIE